MSKSRMESFTDAIIAIIMTLMMLELAAPESPTLASLWDLRYKIIIYALSFATLAVYWINHHHLFQITKKVDHRILWVNILFIFVISLIPFATSWVDQNLFQTVPEMFYGIIILLADLCYLLLTRVLIRVHGNESDLAKVLCNNNRIKVTLIVVSVGVVLGLFIPFATIVLCACSLLLWIVPDRAFTNLFNSDK